jgi:lambda family phage portal protein
VNIFDKAVEAVSPRAALNRRVARVKLNAFDKFFDSGYSHSGASRRKKSMQGWDSASKSPEEDIGYNLSTLRQRSRDLCMSTPIGAAAIVKNRNNVVGSGLTLKSRLDYKTLGISEDEAKAWERKTEFEFNLWASSKIDNTGLNNFYDIQALMLVGWLTNGDSLALIKYVDQSEPTNPYRLRLHCIEADRLSTPDSSGVFNGRLFAEGYGFEDIYNGCAYRRLQNGGAIYNGVETDQTGKAVAYWICNRYPNSELPPYVKRWQPVETVNKVTGLPNVLFVMQADRAEQYRGVPLLAPVIEVIKQISRLTEAELTASITNSFLTAFITTTSPTNGFPLADSVPEDQQIKQPSLGERMQTYEMGPGTMNALGPGESVNFVDPKHPTSGFEGFTMALCKLLGAAIDMPHEVLLGIFQSSYSAARAALLQAWRSFKTKRTWFASDFCQPVYETWLLEAVATGRISAPGFFRDIVTQKLWSNALWIGPSAGQIDPVKEVQAADARVAGGYSTHESETVEMTGQDWDENISILRRENQLLQDAQASIVPAEGGENIAKTNSASK